MVKLKRKCGVFGFSNIIWSEVLKVFFVMIGVFVCMDL